MFNVLKYKSLISYIITIILVFLWVWVVFWSNLVFNPKISKIEKLSNNIFIDSTDLRNNIIVYTSWEDLSWYKLKTACKIKSKYLWNKLDKYFFKISYSNNCLNPIVYLEKDNQLLLNSQTRFNLFTKARLFEVFSDLGDKYIILMKNNILRKIDYLQKLKLYWFKKVQNNRLILEYNYELSILNLVIKFRKQKYLFPVKWVGLPTNLSKIPNSARPYRSTYTDWVHHWWDFDTIFRHDVRAIDNGVIVRVISDFKFSDLKKIKKTWNISYMQKLENLNLLRWNQIWLKTSKWDVVFYSHLDEVNPNIKKWVFVQKWEILWKVWISWVPDKSYKDYHLHFPIMKNPHLISKIWKYNYNDYEKWNWAFKWKSAKYILEHQGKLFEK